MNIKYTIKTFLKKIHLWYPLWDLKESFLSKRKLEAFKKEANRIREASAVAKTNEELVRLIFGSSIFTSQQNVPEIVALLEIVRQQKPKVVCEIGSAGGGTLFLFSRAADPASRFLSIDLRYPTKAHKLSFPFLMGEKQSLTLLEASSQDGKTVEQVKEWLRGDQIDFLFIDGDHSYQGVAQDFELYSPYVRPNGIIAFHDIHPDHRLRYGKKTFAYSGQVPFFWHDLLKKNQYRHAEFIEDPGQDGKGIGVLFLDGRTS